MVSEREEARCRLLSDLPGPHLASGVPHWWPRCKFLQNVLSVLSDVLSSLISALDHGWSFSFLYSTSSLFASSVESKFYYGRTCPSVD